MSANPDRPEVVVELMELSAAELERRAERLLKLSRDLLAQAALHRTLVELPEERSQGRHGIVSEKEAIVAARELGRFTRAELAERLGLSASGVSRWLAKLLAHQPAAIIERLEDGSYRYIDPSPRRELRSAPRAPRGTGRAAGGPGSVAGTGSAALLRGVPKEIQPLVREALREGWKLSRDGGGGHWRLSRAGQTVGFAVTPRNAGDQVGILRQKLSRAQRERARANGHG